MSYHVTRRTTEMGIRSALGANRRNLLVMVLCEALLLSGWSGGQPEAGRFIKSVLFGVTASDPVRLIITVVIMLSVATGAAFIPAWRAAQTDPMTALRAE